MSEEVTEITEQGFLARLGGAIKGVVFGIILILIAFVVLWWNEGRAVQTARSLSEGQGAVISIEADGFKPANNGELVHFSGRAVTDETLEDPTFGIRIAALKLRRSVQMYQWEESESTRTERRDGKKVRVTTYSYSPTWSSSVHHSSEFDDPTGHENPVRIPLESLTVTASQITVGAFTLPDALVRKLSGYDAIAPTLEMAEGVAPQLPPPPSAVAGPVAIDPAVGAPETAEANASAPGQGAGEAQPDEQESVPARSSRSLSWQLSDSHLFYGHGTPAAPSIGDIRVSFSKVEPTDVSIIAEQTANRSLAPYQTEAGDRIMEFEEGLVSADAMFAAAKAANTRMTWILRLVGFVVMALGVFLIVNPLAVVADLIPILGDVLGMSLALVAGLAAFALSLLTIAVAWIVFRPVLGITLLVLAIAAIAALFLLKPRKRQSPTPAEA